MFDKLWVDKYKPNNLNDICSNKNIINNLRIMIKMESFNNMVFTGPSGIGKTSAAICLLKEFFYKRTLLFVKKI